MMQTSKQRPAKAPFLIVARYAPLGLMMQTNSESPSVIAARYAPLGG